MSCSFPLSFAPRYITSALVWTMFMESSIRISEHPPHLVFSAPWQGPPIMLQAISLLYLFLHVTCPTTKSKRKGRLKEARAAGPACRNAGPVGGKNRGERRKHQGYKASGDGGPPLSPAMYEQGCVLNSIAHQQQAASADEGISSRRHQRMRVRIMEPMPLSLPLPCALGPGKTFQKRSVSSPAPAAQQ